MESFRQNFLKKLSNINSSLLEKEVGEVVAVEDSIIMVSGLTKIGFDEAVIVAGKYTAIVAGMENDLVKLILLNKTLQIKVGDEVRRTKEYLSVPVGEGLLGRVVDGLGRPIDNKGTIGFTKTLPVERPAKSVLERKTVDTPLETGLKIVDCLIPIGKGQRQLILGDRQTGKTSIAVDSIINQKEKDVICIYCAIGQRDANTVNVINTLEENGAMDYTIVVNASASSLAGMQYIAPYAATSMAEYFCEKGKNVLIVYDDLSKHARAYREISLLLERSPGREAYPGDIFYLHARLLERSANLKNGGSITSLPIIETEGENISAYIPTNVISITDGQLYLSPSNFQKGLLPAIDVGSSVSRVGGKAQFKAFKQIIGQIGMEYSQFEELEMFSKFATKLDEKTQEIIDRGQLIRELLKQKKAHTISLEGQMAIFICLNYKLLDGIAFNKLERAEKYIVKLVETQFPKISKSLRNNEKISNEEIIEFVNAAKTTLGALK